MSLLDFPSVTLYKQGAQHIQEWSIYVLDEIIYIEHGIHHGKMQIKSETVPRGKGGRSLHQQIVSRVNSRVAKQRLQGYKDTVEEAKQGPSNVMGLPQPMLAQPIGKVKNVDISKAWVQYKYDGNRCLITRQKAQTLAYSRRGKPIENIEHILDGIQLQEGETIDGELYAHGATLQEIVSWVRVKQPGTLRVKFHAYDYVSPAKYIERLTCLRSIQMAANAEVVPTKHMSEINDLTTYFNEAREQGYEGLILRVGNAGYEVNKRSKSLLKMKKFYDQEFEVLGINLSEQDVPIVECACQGGFFKVVAPGSYDEKRKIFENREKYIGSYLTVEFSGLTADKIPFHPVAIRFRSDI